MEREVAPLTLRMAISPTRCWVRNQKVPSSPRKMLTSTNTIIAMWLRISALFWERS